MCLENEIKTLIIESLELEDITVDDIKDDEPLFISGLGLDSIDALELGMALKKKYNVDLSDNKEENKKYFYSVKTIADFIRSKVVKLSKQYTREQIFDRLKEILADDFEIEPEKLVLDANLFEDLELDSIDAVDLAVKLQEFTEKKISPENFKQIRTIDDVVSAIEELL